MEHERLALLRRILELTEAQTALLAEEDKDLLLENLDRRQACIDRLAALSSPLPEDLREEAAALEEQIMARDKRNERLMRDELALLQDRMRRTRQGRTAASQYDGLGSDLGATYFDKER